jgi:hypothetical protein
VAPRAHDAAGGILARRSTPLVAPRTYDPAVVHSSSGDEPADSGVLVLSRTSRLARLAGTAVVLALLLGGTVWGEDSEFPFGPFRMYSTRADPGQPVVSTRVVGRTADGAEIRLSGGEVGLRRAEFEGQVDRMRADPSLLVSLAEVYAERHPDAEDLVEVQVIHRRFELEDGRRTGNFTDAVIVDQDLEATP